MSDPIEYTDGNYVSLAIEELPYERADENDYHLKFLELSSQDSDGLITLPSSMGLKGNDEFPLDDNAPLLVAPVLLVPKTKRIRTVVKKQKKKTKKYRKNPRTKKRALGRPSLRSS